MSKRTVRFLENVDLVAADKCYGKWVVTDSRGRDGISPLQILANFDSPFQEEGCVNFCKQHGHAFSLYEGCPAVVDIEDLKAAAGEVKVIAEDQAGWLVQNGLAHYSKEHASKEVDDNSRLRRVNDLIEGMGLPGMDAEGIRGISATNTRSSGGRAATPQSRSLASDLGLDMDDIAEMRRMGSSK